MSTAPTDTAPELRTSRPLSLVLPAAIFLLTLFACSCVIYIDYRNSEKLLTQEKLTTLKIEGKLLQPQLQQVFEQAYQDVRFLSQMPTVEQFLDTYKETQDSRLNPLHSKLEIIFSEMMVAKSIYKKIRFIGLDNDGLELIRVNREITSNRALSSQEPKTEHRDISVTPAKELQHKGHRYYLKETAKLPKGQVFFSAIELNREHGKVSTPHSSVIRVATPIYTDSHNDNGSAIFGIIIISVDFDLLRNKLLQQVPEDTDLFLGNASGDYLIHPDKDKVFGFDLDLDHKLQNDFPSLQPAIERSLDSTDTTSAINYLKDQENNNFLAFFHSVNLQKFNIDTPLHFLLLQSDRHLQSSINDLVNQSLILGLSLSLLSLAFSLLLVRKLLLPLSRMTTAMDIYNRTGKRCQLPLQARDEIGLLARSFYNLLNTKEKNDKDLIQARQAAEASAKSKSEFLANMSHEIRTPMNGVIGTLDLLLRGQLEQQQQHYASLAQNSAESLLVIINDILDFSKIDANKLELEHIDFNLKELLQSVYDSVSISSKNPNIDINLSIPDNIPTWVKGDPSRLRQIFNNLVGNAIKFTDQGHITIGVDTTLDNKVVFSVSDTGIGIAADKIDSLFDAFVQEDSSTTRQFGGTGLGLAIAQQLVSLMGGNLQVDSTKGQGSKFYFSLELDLGEEKQPQKAAQLDISGKNILIVDDNQTNRTLLHDQLALEGANITVANNGHDALIKLAQRPSADHFAIIMIDMQMPGIDGTGLGALIQKDQSLQQSHVILMTSMDRGDNTTICDRFGFCASLTKPVRADSLYQTLANAMQQRSLQQARSKRLLLVDDNEVNLLVAKDNLIDMGFDIYTAKNGKEALSKLQNMTFDLVFMDCMMPIMDGYQTTQAIRNNEAGERNANVTIVAMTANAMKGDDQKCYDAGMDDYLTKPIDTVKLHSTLSKWLDICDDPNQENSEQQTEKAIEDVSAVIVWDRKSLLKRVGGKPDRVEKLVHIFIDNSEQTLLDLNRASQSNSLSEMASIAHGIKGSAANLGAESLSQSAATLEHLTKQGSGDIQSAQSALERSYKELLLLLKSEYNIHNN